MTIEQNSGGAKAGRAAKIHIITAFALAALFALNGCKKAPSPAGKPPPAGGAFIAYYRAAPGGTDFEIWRARASGGKPEKYFTTANPGGRPLSAIGPGVSLLSYNSEDGRIYYTYGNSVYSHPGRRGGEPVARLNSVAASGIKNVWISRGGDALLSLFTWEEDRRTASEYITLNLKNGEQKRISPSDPEWDAFDFYNGRDFCYIGCEGRGFKSGRGGAAFMLEQPAGGAAGWPKIVIIGKGRRTTITDGSRRVLAARWSASGRAIAFIESENCPAEGSCAGRLRFANADTGEVSQISDSPLPAEAIFNVSSAEDAVYYSEQPSGVFKFDFSTGKKTAVDPYGVSPYLAE